MAINDTLTEKSQLCALVSQAVGEQAIGSAAQFQHCLVLELPAPWPRDAFQAPHVPAGVMALLGRLKQQGLKIRPQAILPDNDYSLPEHTRVIYYQCPSEAITQYQKVEYLIPDGDLIPLLVALFEKPEALAQFTPYQQETNAVRDLLVCTHGVRDTCCGKFGIPLYQRLREAYANPNLRVWRTSHTGGHRFAPTLIDFPSGHYWGRLTPDLLDMLVHRQGASSDLVDGCYRGWSAVSPLEQVAEQAVWQQEGWDWLTYAKTSRLVEENADEHRATVEIAYTQPDGLNGSYQAVVEQYDTVMTLASSGTGPLREEPLYRVQNLVKLV